MHRLESSDQVLLVLALVGFLGLIVIGTAGVLLARTDIDNIRRRKRLAVAMFIGTGIAALSLIGPGVLGVLRSGVIAVLPLVTILAMLLFIYSLWLMFFIIMDREHRDKDFWAEMVAGTQDDLLERGVLFTKPPFGYWNLLAVGGLPGAYARILRQYYAEHRDEQDLDFREDNAPFYYHLIHAFLFLQKADAVILSCGKPQAVRSFSVSWKAIESGKFNRSNLPQLLGTIVASLSEILEAGTYFDLEAISQGAFSLSLGTRPIFGDLKLPEALPVFFLTPSIELDAQALCQYLETTFPSTRIVVAIVVSEQIPKDIRDLAEQMRSIYAYDLVPLAHSECVRIVLAKDPQRIFRQLVLPQVNLITVSPYIDRGPTGDRMFFGRESQLREVTEHIGHASYAIIGGRRVGKSSLLGHLHRVRLPAVGIRTLFHDCSNISTSEAFLNATISDWQPRTLSNASVTFGDLLQSLPDDKALVLLLDEGDKLVPADRANNWRLFNMLRALANSGRVQVVLSGERTLRDALRNPTSPLFNFANEMLLGPLDFRAVEELVIRPMKQLEIELEDEQAIVQRIWDFTSGHPNVVQRLCRRLIERLNEQGTRRITLDDVDKVINEPRFQEEDFLSTYWERATPLEQIISLLMAQEARLYRLQAVLDLLAAEDLRPEPEVVKAALDRLVDLRSILKRTQAGYEFAVEAFPSVIANRTTAEDLLIVLKSQYLKNPAESVE